MQITPNEISSIEEVGTLSGNQVKMVRTKGGFWMAIARKKGKQAEECLAAGSHPAIVKYQLEKQFPEFQSSMMKSEGYIEPVVISHSHFLTNDLRKSGHDIFSIQTGPAVEFHITKHNNQIVVVNGEIEKDHLSIEKLNISKEFGKAMAGATVEKSLGCKIGLKLRK